MMRSRFGAHDNTLRQERGGQSAFLRQQLHVLSNLFPTNLEFAQAQAKWRARWCIWHAELQLR
jgi:hypothetical protein